MEEKKRIYMQDRVQFLEENIFDTKMVLQCLNEENYLILREELAIKYNKKSKSNLIELLED